MVSREKMEDYFYFGTFLITMLIALISAIWLYMAVDRLISTWFDYRYLPIFQAFFYLSVLAICIYLIRERLIRRD